MITFSEQQKHDWLDEFNCVAALYQILKGQNSLRLIIGSVRIVPSICVLDSASEKKKLQRTLRRAEVQEVPLDFLWDVELKAKRSLTAPLYNMFIRLGIYENLNLLPEHAKLELGKVWKEWGLGVEGDYARLFFKIKNDQIRNYLRGNLNGRSSDDTGTGPEATATD